MLRECVICVSCFASFSALAQEAASEPSSVPTSMPVTMPTSVPVVVPQKAEDGKLKVSFSGFVAAQLTIDTNDAVGQNHLVSVAGDGDGARLGYAFDASRFNLVAKRSADGIDLEGRAEVDMENGIFFRVRHAYASATKNNLSLLLGQTDTLVGNMVGPSLFNNDWFFAQGNAYDRTQQFRVTYHAGNAALAIAAVPNLYGAVSAVPHMQASLRTQAGPAQIGIGAHFGTTNNVDAGGGVIVDGVTSYLVAADAGIAAGPAFISLQGWLSSGGAHGTGGHAIGNPLFVVGTSGNPTSVPSAGGFLDVIINANKKLYFGAAGGASIITQTALDGVNVPLKNNFTGGAYLGYSATEHWRIAFDAQFAQTATALDPATPDVYTNVSDFRLLFGQKISF